MGMLMKSVLQVPASSELVLTQQRHLESPLQLNQGQCFYSRFLYDSFYYILVL